MAIDHRSPLCFGARVELFCHANKILAPGNGKVKGESEIEVSPLVPLFPFQRSEQAVGSAQSALSHCSIQLQNWVVRRRGTLFVSFLLLLLFVASFSTLSSLNLLLSPSPSQMTLYSRQFWWELIIDLSSLESEGGVTTCKHTQQGPHLAVDDRGYLCTLKSLSQELSGCCDEATSARYSCDQCTEGCCSAYELCVSCCLGTLQNVPHGISSFTFCTATCRTSSRSILPDHRFSQPDQKFCFLNTPT